MDVGDLLEGHGAYWLVRKVESDLRTGIVESATGETRSVGFEELATEGFRRVCNAPQDWPLVSLPQRRGRIVEVQLAALRGNTPLARFKDWIKLDDFQIGGALYVNPELRLAYRDRLVIVYAPAGKTSVSIPVEIPRDFTTLKVKIARASTPPPSAPKGPPTLFDHILGDE